MDQMATVTATTATTDGRRRAIELGPLGTLARRRFQLTARTPLFANRRPEFYRGLWARR